MGAAPPPEAGGTGLGLPLLRLPQRGDRPLAWAQFVFGCQAPDAGNAEILHLFGTDDQKARVPAPLVAGEVRSFFSMTEPDVAGRIRRCCGRAPYATATSG